MRWGLLVSVALGACSSSSVPVSPPSVPRTGTWVFVSLGPDDAARALYVFDGNELPDPLNLPHDEGVRHRLLIFSERLDALTALPDITGSVAVLEPDARGESAWTLPPPRAAFELIDDSYQSTSPAELGAWLASFTVPRPPCPAPPQIRAIEGLGPQGQISSVVRRGDELLIGAKLDVLEGSPGGVYRLPLGQLELVPFPEFAGGANAKIWLDGDTAHVLWVDPTRTFAQSSIDPSGAVSSPQPFFIDTPAGTVTFEEVAAGFGTVVARMEFFEMPTAPVISMLVSLDEPARTWRVVHASAPGTDVACSSAGSKLHLEVDGPGLGVAGLNDGPLTRFDLSLPDGGVGKPLTPQGRMCRNARVILDGGVELVTYAVAGDAVASDRRAISWRRPGDVWARVPSSSALAGHALGAVGNVVLAGGDSRGVVGFEYAPSRPELPPRQCFDLPLGLHPHHIMRIDEDTAFVSGFQSGGGVFLDFGSTP